MWAHTWRANATKYTIDRYSGFDWMVGTDGRECAAGSDGAIAFLFLPVVGDRI